MGEILARETQRVKHETIKKLGRPRKAITKRRKRRFGQRGRNKELGNVAIVLLKYLPKQVNRYVSLASLASKLKFKHVTIKEIRTAIDQLVYFGFIRKINYQRPYKDGTPSKRSGFILEKIYGYDDRIEMKELALTLYESPEQRSKIRERRSRWAINNLILPDDGDAATTVRLLRSVGVETIRFYGKNHNTISIRDVEKIIQSAESKNYDVMGRVDGATYGTLIQLDEVSRSLLARLLPLAFMAFETSPDNFQVWFALPLHTPVKQRNRIRARLIQALNPNGDEKGVNGGSHGEMRWPESINQKPKHNGFRVRLIHGSMGQFITSPELDADGLLAPVPKRERPPKDRSSSSQSQMPEASRQNDLVKTVPDYAALLGKHGGNRHITDGLFLIACIKRGFTKTERRQLLFARSTKCREQGEAYFDDREKFARESLKRREEFAANAPKSRGKELIN
jgi:RepB DNA-primase from phage plasmid